MSGLHIIKFPSGRFRFFGRVPQVFAYRGHPDDLATAAQCGSGFARRVAERNGRTFEVLWWDTEEDACAAATAAGFDVEPYSQSITEAVNHSIIRSM